MTALAVAEAILAHTTPRPPRWAIETGFPEPMPGEPAAAYWTRVGLGDRLAWAVEGLSERTADLANVRLAGVVKAQAPRAFARWHAEQMERHAPNARKHQPI